jgi:hypothetical protein
MYQIGDRVKVTVDNFELKERPATIVYIDSPTIFSHEFSPIQVELDKPYDDSGQTIIRVSLREIKPLKKSENYDY